MAFLHTIQSIVEELDPKKENFVIEDTGLDVEIILTVEGQGNKSKDFDKEEGVYFLNEQLNLDRIPAVPLFQGIRAATCHLCVPAYAVMEKHGACLLLKMPSLRPRYRHCVQIRSLLLVQMFLWLRLRVWPMNLCLREC